MIMNKFGRDLKVGDMVYGRQIKYIRAYQVPAKVLIASVAAQHPDGLPGRLVEYVGGGGITIFDDDDVPAENEWAPK